jgi:putative endonuclease
MDKAGYIYILSNKNRTTFYTGMTNNLCYRATQHKSGVGSKFAAKYNLTALVYYEEHSTIQDAIRREKQLKNWHRNWKVKLIKAMNPMMLDLYNKLCPDYL